MSAVAGVVVTHGPHPELDRCLAALGAQVDELVVVSNPPAPAVDARLIVNEKARGFAANANRGIAETTAPFVVVANADTEASPEPSPSSATSQSEHPRCGIAGPAPAQLRRHVSALSQEIPDRLAERSCAGRRSGASSSRRSGSSATICSSSGPSIRRSPTGCSARFCSCAGRCSTSSAASTKASASTARTSTSATGPSRPAGSAGSCRRPPSAMRHAAVTDRRFLTRQTLWHWRSIARFVRKHPERLRNI